MREAREHQEETVTELDDAVRTVVSAMLSGTSTQQVYLEQVIGLCRAKPPPAHRLLAQSERYHRLGRMPSSQYRAVRACVEDALQSPESGRVHGLSGRGAAVPEPRREP